MIFIVLMLLLVRNSWGAHMGVHPWCTCCPLLGTEIYCQDGFLVTRLVPGAPSSSVFLHVVPLFLRPLHGVVTGQLHVLYGGSFPWARVPRDRKWLLLVFEGLGQKLTQHYLCHILLVREVMRPSQIPGEGAQAPPLHRRTTVLFTNILNVPWSGPASGYCIPCCCIVRLWPRMKYFKII